MEEQHNIFGILFSGHHYLHPFSCPCENENQSHDHSLTLLQKVTVLAVSLIFAIPTYGIGLIPAFYVLTAALKARNSVWTVYTRDNPARERFFMFIPAWWGIHIASEPLPRYNWQYQSEYIGPSPEVSFAANLRRLNDYGHSRGRHETYSPSGGFTPSRAIPVPSRSRNVYVAGQQIPGFDPYRRGR